MNEQEFQQKLGELLNQIDELPTDKQAAIRDLADQSRNRHDKLKKSVKELQDSLDYLRLSIKYLVFDLEATRRENQYLRKMLERQAGENGNSEGHQND